MSGVRHSMTTEMMEVLRDCKKEERIKVPEVKKYLDDTVAQCITAIEEDRVDSLVIVNGLLVCFEDDVRQMLDEAGYSEIQIIYGFYAAVEMAKAMVNMKLMQAPRAYPGEDLKAKPRYW